MKKYKPFDAYELSPVVVDGDSVEVDLETEKPDFYSLYGHVDGEGVICIGDFKTREHALEIYQRIVGDRQAEFPLDDNTEGLSESLMDGQE